MEWVENPEKQIELEHTGTAEELANKFCFSRRTLFNYLCFNLSQFSLKYFEAYQIVFSFSHHSNYQIQVHSTCPKADLLLV